MSSCYALLSRTSSASALSGSRRTPALRNGRKTLTLPLPHLVYPSYRYRSIRQEILSAFLRLCEKRDRRRSIIPQTPIVGRVYKEIAAFAIAERLPTITTSNVFAREGLLMSYGSDLGSIWRLAAHYTDQLCGVRKRQICRCSCRLGTSLS